MLYSSSRDDTPRRDATRPSVERRAFSRRIDCDEAGRVRRPVNPAAATPERRDPQLARGRRRLDID